MKAQQNTNGNSKITLKRLGFIPQTEKKTEEALPRIEINPNLSYTATTHDNAHNSAARVPGLKPRCSLLTSDKHEIQQCFFHQTLFIPQLSVVNACKFSFPKTRAQQGSHKLMAVLHVYQQNAGATRVQCVVKQAPHLHVSLQTLVRSPDRNLKSQANAIVDQTTKIRTCS